MPYQIQQFDDINLPVYNPTQQHDPQSGASVLVDSIGGFFNRFGGDDARAQRQTIVINGLVLGEDTYMDDAGGGIDSIESNADVWLVGDGPTILRSQLQAIRDKVRKQGTLWRVNLGKTPAQNGAREWKTAYFVRMGQPQVLEDRVLKAEVSLEFEPLMVNWHAEETVAFTTTSTGSTPASLVVENPGATVYDAVLSITCTSGTITGLVVACAALGISWSRATTSISSGQTLVIDAGQQTMLRDGANHYSLVYGGHTAKGWFPIEPGSYTFTLTLGGGNANISLSFYPQIP